MKSLILDAGKATRLYPLSKITPKSLIDVKRKPVLEHILENIGSSPKIEQAYIMHSHEFEEQFQKFHRYYGHPDLKIEIISDKNRNPDKYPGSIGGISYIVNKKKIEDDLLVVGGDNLYDFRIDDFVNFFIRNNKETSIAAYDFGNKEEVAQKFGVIELEEDNVKVKGFEEKPYEPKTALISTLCYLISKKDLPLLNEPEIPKENTGEFIKYLVNNSTVNAYQFRGKWFDIGTFEGLDKARKEF